MLTIIFLFDRMNRRLLELHAFSLLRFFSQFQNFLELSGYEKNNGHVHPLICRVEASLAEAGVPKETFLVWQENIKTHFRRRNFLGLSIEDVPDMSVDVRPLLERIDTLQTVVLEMRAELNASYSKIQENNTMQSKTLEILTKLQSQVQDLASTSPHVTAQSSLQTATYTPSILPPRVPAPWPEVKFRQDQPYDAVFACKYKSSQISCEQTFKIWFLDQLPVAYSNMSDPAKKKKYKNQFSQIKTMVLVMIKNLESYPPPGSDAMSLTKLAAYSLSKIRARHNLDELPTRTRISQSRNIKGIKVDSIFKTGNYDNQPFPERTPQCIIEYFGKIPTTGSRMETG